MKLWTYEKDKLFFKGKEKQLDEKLENLIFKRLLLTHRDKFLEISLIEKNMNHNKFKLLYKTIFDNTDLNSEMDYLLYLLNFLEIEN